VASLGLINGKELLAKLDDHKTDDLLREAIREAKRNSLAAWSQCEPLDEADELELGGMERLKDPLLYIKSESSNEDDTIEGAFPPLCERPSFTVAFFATFILVGMVLCVTVFADDLADAADLSKEDFITKFLKYASIPIGTTIFTYAHVWLALWCTFYPLEFVGCCQIPGTNVGFPIGWRGIIPFKGDEMARMAVRMIKQNLLTVDEVFTRLDPNRMAEVLRPAISKKMEQIVETVAMEEAPRLWSSLPLAVKREAIRQAGAESPAAVRDMLLLMRPEIETLLDLEHLVVDVLVGDLRLCVDVFVVCGYKELGFIRNVGAVMGGCLGLAQMTVWFFYKGVWFLPVIGCLAGALTNYLALLLIFWPLYPVNICGLTLHGRFLRRQKEVANAYGKLVHRHVLKVKNIVNELLNGGEKARVQQIVRESVYRTVDRSLGPLNSFTSMVPGSNQLIERVKDRVTQLINESMFDIMMEAEDYMDKALDLEYTLESRMSKLDYPKFESLLHPIFQAEEWKLVLVGGVVGLIFGTLQVLFIAN
jgi:uncharacterized membrane protein YheB (UPF0754 family)